MKPLHVKATPKFFDDMVFAEERIKNKAQRLSSQLITGPLLITGASGVGKSSLAKLIATHTKQQFEIMYPDASKPEFTHFYPDLIRPKNFPDEIIYDYNPYKEFEGDELAEYTDEERYHLFSTMHSNHNHLKISVIDRVNFLTEFEQRAVISAVDAYRRCEHNFHIFVSNDLRNTLPELFSVCDVIDLRTPKPEQYIVRLRQIAREFLRVKVDDRHLLELASRHKGNFRKMLLDLELIGTGLWDI